MNSPIKKIALFSSLCFFSMATSSIALAEQISSSIQCQNSNCTLTITYNNEAPREYKFSQVKKTTSHLTSSGLLIVELLNGNIRYFQRIGSALTEIDRLKAEEIEPSLTIAPEIQEACSKAFSFSSAQNACATKLKAYSGARDHALAVLNACASSLSFDSNTTECLEYSLNNPMSVSIEKIYACSSESFDNSILKCIKR